ncbi:hypothetical protein [Candidatus Pantoea persica]|uniref:hypothetical protein n=1 Tax=Candidatus Pantoea persica TaxID=2518128 RepID=UPI00215DC54D|nr:hypothetical protein [Candidatus Pantoea persica]MBA2814271.1 hypothetical protein [Candidatus Pantoea persica]
MAYVLTDISGLGAYRVLSDGKWSEHNAVSLNSAVNPVYLYRINLAVAFDKDGKQVSSLLAGLGQMCINCGEHMTPQSSDTTSDTYSLIAENQ